MWAKLARKCWLLNPTPMYEAPGWWLRKRALNSRENVETGSFPTEAHEWEKKDNEPNSSTPSTTLR